MKKILALFGLAATALSAVATPEVDNVSFTQSKRTVAIGYRLSGEPAVVTFDVETNGVSIGRKVIRNYSGDVGVLVQPGTRTISWNLTAPFPKVKLENARIRVTAYPTNSPPDYLVADLDTGDARYYPDADALPFDGGVTNDLCKTRYLVLRKIPARGKVWVMGAEPYEVQVESSDVKSGNLEKEVPHYVVLTEDYYMGVYEFTYDQWVRVVGNGSGLYGSKESMKSGVSGPCFEKVRGATSGHDWPNDGHAVADDSLLGKLRAKVPNILFDLPTEAQWEFACRAGTQSAFNNGGACKESEFRKVGWFYASQRFYPSDVGQLLANAWGLYDMHGNVGEFCLDWSATGADYIATFGSRPGGVTVDPIGPTSGTGRVVRGGGINTSYANERSASRSSQTPGTQKDTSYQNGFRVWAPADAK